MVGNRQRQRFWPEHCGGCARIGRSTSRHSARPTRRGRKGVQLEDDARQQLLNVAQLPFIYKWVSDHAAIIVLPSLLASVRKAAARVKLEASASGAETHEDVAAGRINMILCPEEAPPSLEAEMLFTLDFVRLVRAALRVRARHLTLKQYLECKSCRPSRQNDRHGC
jgi:DNA-binding transcriptional LysR family regulator